MKHTILILLLGFLFSSGLAAQGSGSSALASLPKNKFSGSNTAMTPNTPKHKDKKKSLSGHMMPDAVENEKVMSAFSNAEYGNYDAAIDGFDDYSAEDPDAAFGLGLVQYEMGKGEEAIASLENAVALDPQNAEAWYVLALVYAESGNYDRAEECYLAALSLDPEDPDIWYELGYIYYDAGLYDEAEYCLKVVLELDPEYAYDSY